MGVFEFSMMQELKREAMRLIVEPSTPQRKTVGNPNDVPESSRLLIQLLFVLFSTWGITAAFRSSSESSTRISNSRRLVARQACSPFLSTDISLGPGRGERRGLP